MFSLTLPNARHFKRCCDCLRDVVHEVRVRITPEGLVASAEANGTHVSAHFHAKHAIEYKADLSCMMRPETCTFGLATDTLAKLLRAASAEQRSERIGYVFEKELAGFDQVELKAAGNDQDGKVIGYVFPEEKIGTTSVTDTVPRSEEHTSELQSPI